MKYYLIAGEASGDIHAAELMIKIAANDIDAQFEFLGGDLMCQVGGKMHIHYRQMAFMGVLPVLLNLRKIKHNLDICKQTLLAFKPDVLILVDYPGFNLRMAKFAKEHGIKTAYYISPKIWAWKTGRIKQIKAYVDHMYTILPFETAFYQQYNYQVTYVGNPLFDKISAYAQKAFNKDEFFAQNQLDSRSLVALLPGSRYHEITKLLPSMTQLASLMPEYQFVVAGFDGVDQRIYQDAIKAGIKIVYGQTYSLLVASTAAVVASGTATLETALLKVPQVVCYKMSPQWILEKIRPWILKTEFFSLVNLIAGREVVKELFQSKVSAENFRHELNKIFDKGTFYQQMIDGYQLIEERLKTEGASEKAAKAICSTIM